MKFSPVITCEHAGNNVPPDYLHLFEGQEKVLQSHRGWDPGAIDVASVLSKKLSAPFFICETTRLLVEPNRSLNSDSLFSEYSRTLADPEKIRLLEEFYHPHRTAVEDLIRNSSRGIMHLSIHTFTPIWNDSERMVDVGLLFDPDRAGETNFCEKYIALLRRTLPSINIEFNEPYKGIDDGFTTYLRTRFDNEQYLGIEIEINQKYVGTQALHTITSALSTALIELDLF